MFAHAFAVQQDRVIALVDHRIAAPGKGIALAVGMEQVDQAALRMHHVVVQVRLQPFPQLQGMGVEFRIAGQEVIGAHDGGVAPDIARPEIALFQHGDVGHPVVLGQVIGGGQAMPAAADDDGVIFGLRRRVAPDGFPALVAEQPFGDDLQTRIAHRTLSRHDCGPFAGCAMTTAPDGKMQPRQRHALPMPRTMSCPVRRPCHGPAFRTARSQTLWTGRLCATRPIDTI